MVVLTAVAVMPELDVAVIVARWVKPPVPAGTVTVTQTVVWAKGDRFTLFGVKSRFQPGLDVAVNVIVSVMLPRLDNVCV